MKRWLVLLLTLGILLTSCGQQFEIEQYALYYASSSSYSGAAILSESITDDVDEISDLLALLFNGPTDTITYDETFPDGTAVRTCTIDGNILYIDLTDAFGQLSGMSLTLAEYCIVLTSLQWDGIEYVKITVGGQQLPGIEDKALSADDLVMNGETSDPIIVNIPLYFPNTDHSDIGVEYREVSVFETSAIALANTVIDELCAGPQQKGLIASFSELDSPLILGIQDKICSVELTPELYGSLGEISDGGLNVQLQSLVNSLCEIEGIDSVVFTISGEDISEEVHEFFPNYS